jgi:hypothetical protein
MSFKLVSTIIALIIISSIGSSQFLQEDRSNAISYSTSDLDNLTSEIILQKVNYSIGESVNWTYEIHNSGGKWINLSWGNIPYYDYDFDSSTSTNFWKWPYMEPPHVVLPMIADLDVPPHGNTSISPIEGWHLENISSGYYRVWLALLGHPELSAWAYFKVGNPTSDVSADFSQSISYDASTENYTLTANASISKNLFNGNSALEFRWDWESDGTWDTNWSHILQDSHIFNVTGNHSICLGVRDVFGNSDAISKIITIEAITLDDVVTTVKTDKLVYEKGENISVTVTLTNPTNSSIFLVYGSYPPWEIEIFAEKGTRVYRWTGIDTMMSYHTLLPNKSINYTRTVTTKSLDPGFYLINGSGYDAPTGQIWIKVNGTIQQDSATGYDSLAIGIVLIVGAAFGIIVGYFLSRRGKN